MVKKLPSHLQKVVRAIDSGRRFNSKTGKPGKKLTDKEKRSIGKILGAKSFRSSSGKIKLIKNKK